MKAILLSCLAVWLPLSVARACSCVSSGGSEKQKIEAAYRRGALIFVGRVVSVETVVTTDTVQISDTGSTKQRTRLIKHETLRYTFAVARQLKGQFSGPTVLISTETQSSSCGKQFKIGSEQLVYAFLVSQEASVLGGEPRSVPPYHATSLCERNQELKYVKAAELRQLNQLAKAS